jgi:hypothetical protein
MIAWVGVGWSLVAAILFSGAAMCLRGEREREEAINMQYLMPGNFRGHSHRKRSMVFRPNGDFPRDT